MKKEKHLERAERDNGSSLSNLPSACFSDWIFRNKSLISHGA